jgi:glycosyltransferase involved in cell wall biosynthesis
MKKAIISVVSDLVTDQRVHRVASALQTHGLYVTLVGREMKKSLPLAERDYNTVRFKLWWEKGPLFYAAYNVRLFFYLLFHKADVIVSNDLDTLLPNFLISKIKGSELYYDSHEYFTEVPELVNRKRTQKIWKKIEGMIFPRLKHAYTVNGSIASLFENKYHVPVGIIRNVPVTVANSNVQLTRAEAGLPEWKKIILFQGAGINIHRGAEEALEAMIYLHDAVLLFIGSGDVIEQLKDRCVVLNLSDRVFFLPKMPMSELKKYTRLADIGLTLDKDTNINYRYSLPNKLFDYIHAGIPVLASPLVEVKRIIDRYRIGMTVDSHDPKSIAEKINEMLSDDIRFAQWKENTKHAARELCWEKEEKELLKIYRDVL